MTMIEVFSKIKTKEDISPDVKRFVFEKFLTLMQDAGFIVDYLFDDFKMLWIGSLPYTLGFLCPFKDGLLKIGYHALEQNFNVQLTINPKTKLSKPLFMIDDMSSSSIYLQVDNDFNFKSINFSYRICFEDEVGSVDSDGAFLDIDYTYDHVSPPLKEFKICQYFTSIDSNDCDHSLKLPPIFYKNDLDFDHLFFDYISNFTKKDSVFNTVFPNTPSLYDVINDPAVLQQLCIQFSNDYYDHYSVLCDRLLVLNMSKI